MTRLEGMHSELLVWKNLKHMIVAEILTSIMGAYFVYMLQKIDNRQDKIEIDVEIIKHSIHKRKDDLTDDLTTH